MASESWDRQWAVFVDKHLAPPERRRSYLLVFLDGALQAESRHGRALDYVWVGSEPVPRFKQPLRPNSRIAVVSLEGQGSRSDYLVSAKAAGGEPVSVERL